MVVSRPSNSILRRRQFALCPRVHFNQIFLQPYMKQSAFQSERLLTSTIGHSFAVFTLRAKNLASNFHRMIAPGDPSEKMVGKAFLPCFS